MQAIDPALTVPLVVSDELPEGELRFVGDELGEYLGLTNGDAGHLVCSLSPLCGDCCTNRLVAVMGISTEVMMKLAPTGGFPGRNYSAGPQVVPGVVLLNAPILTPT